MGRQSVRHTGEREKLQESHCPCTAAVSPKHTGHGPPHPLGHPELSPALVTASASPQRREMHAGKERQDNGGLSKSEEG